MPVPPRYPSKRRVAQTASLSAPTGGWNARDSLADMSPMDAVILTNWFPGTNEVVLRKGYSEQATGLGSQVETLMAYDSGQTDEMFAIAGTSVYDVTSAGAVGAPVLTGLTNARWEYINYATTSGGYLYMVNGTDDPYTYDGTTWANPSLTPPMGVLPSEFNSVNAHQSRIWFTRRFTLEAYFLDALAISGNATLFDLSSIAQMGGFLVGTATWTIDAGYGLDDLLAFITSEGEIIIYKGTDVTSANSWQLVGVFRVGSPVGDARCWLKYAGDLLVITKDGVVPMSSALQSSRTNPKVAVTDKIQSATNTAISVSGDNFGWQMVDFPLGNQLWLNVPVQEGSLQQQYVMNTINKSWANYTGWEANCWVLFQDMPYFGGNGFVGAAWTTNADNGSNIDADALQAFNYFGRRGELKRYTMARPIFRTNGNPAAQVNVNIDFDTNDTTTPLTFSPTVYAAWDSALWDTGIWGGDLNVLKNWQGLTGVGYCAGIRLNTASNGIDLTWVSTDIVMEEGEVL